MNRFPLQEDAPLIGSELAGNEIEQGGFARPVGANEAGNLALLDAATDAVQCQQPAKTFGHLTDLKQRHRNRLMLALPAAPAPLPQTRQAHGGAQLQRLGTSTVVMLTPRTAHNGSPVRGGYEGSLLGSPQNLAGHRRDILGHGADVADFPHDLPVVPLELYQPIDQESHSHQEGARLNQDAIPEVLCDLGDALRQDPLIVHDGPPLLVPPGG